MIASADGGRTWTGAATPTRAPIDELFWGASRLWLVSHGRSFFSQQPCASVEVVGSGCHFNSNAQGPELDANRALLGQTTSLFVDSAPANSLAGVMLLGLPAARPIPITANCSLYIDIVTGPLVTLGTVTITNGSGRFALPLPNLGGLDCSKLALQTVVLTQTSQLWLTNGVVLTLGR